MGHSIYRRSQGGLNGSILPGGWFCEKFDITIPDDTARTIRTVGDAVKVVDELKK